MIFSREKDLFSPEIMRRFFSKNRRILYGEKLISLKVRPQKRIAKNKLIIYELFITKGKRKKMVRIFGKTMKSEQFGLFKFLAKTKVGGNIPHYFKYFKSLNFSLSEDVGGRSIRDFENRMDFWKKNAGKIGIMLSGFQRLKTIPRSVKNYSQREEKKFISDSLKNIVRYSSSEGEYYLSITKGYLKNLRSNCLLGSQFSFTHFDFQPSNILYSEKKKSFYLLDFDLVKKFSPALDAANFLAHLYVMLRHHYAEGEIKQIMNRFLKSYFSASGLDEKRLRQCLNIFKMRSAIDIAQMTANTFGKASQGSRRVFRILRELLKLCL